MPGRKACSHNTHSRKCRLIRRDHSACPKQIFHILRLKCPERNVKIASRLHFHISRHLVDIPVNLRFPSAPGHTVRALSPGDHVVRRDRLLSHQLSRLPKTDRRSDHRQLTVLHSRHIGSQCLNISEHLLSRLPLHPCHLFCRKSFWNDARKKDMDDPGVFHSEDKSFFSGKISDPFCLRSHHCPLNRRR